MYERTREREGGRRPVLVGSVVSYATRLVGHAPCIGRRELHSRIKVEVEAGIEGARQPYARRREVETP